MKSKSLVCVKYGFNLKKNLKFIDVNISKLKPNEVQIEVFAASVNPADYKIIYGFARIVKNYPCPFAVGFDLAGVIVGKGVDVQELNIGDEVYSKVPWDQMGTITQIINVRSDMVSLKPRNISFSEAASLPLVSCTVLDSFNVAEIKKGTKLLIIGGSGGIGTFAIQYAKYLGAYVYVTTSSANVEFVKSLGADEVIEYDKVDFRYKLDNLDVVFDAVGGKYAGQSLKVVKRGGKIVSIAGHHDDETLSKLEISTIIRILFRLKGAFLMFRMKKKNVLYKHVWSYPNRDSLNIIRELVENAKIKPVVDKEYQFADAINALTYLQTKRATGKVVIKIKS
ncbi:MAG: NADP-dependent oxidoreductase [Flavobacteriia bacterium]|jgi:NADPH:quinone reductase-like Zn-dependent oxidoreductase